VTTLRLFLGTTARRLNAARRAGVLDPDVTLIGWRRFAALYAEEAAERDARARGTAEAVVAELRVDEALLLPGSWLRCRYAVRPLPIAAIRHVEAVRSVKARDRRGMAADVRAAVAEDVRAARLAPMPERARAAALARLDRPDLAADRQLAALDATRAARMRMLAAERARHAQGGR
jgi:hypothetical protein